METDTKTPKRTVLMVQRESDKMGKEINSREYTKEEGTTKNELDPVKSTRHITTKESEGYIPIVPKFSADRKFRKSIERDIIRAPKGRMARRDEVFVEMMKLSRKRLAELLARY